MERSLKWIRTSLFGRSSAWSCTIRSTTISGIRNGDFSNISNEEAAKHFTDILLNGITVTDVEIKQ